MEWIELVNQIDHHLHSIGVPSSIRGPAVAQVSSILAQADKHRRTRRQLAIEAIARNGGNVRAAAKAEKWSYETFYSELRPQKVKSTADG